MGVLLMLGLAVIVTALQAVILAYLWREAQVSTPPVLHAADVLGPPRFFQVSVGPAAHGAPASAHLPLLLQRLEQHIRLEKAAAESFHRYPTVASLHKHTDSPLLH